MVRNCGGLVVVCTAKVELEIFVKGAVSIAFIERRVTLLLYFYEFQTVTKLTMSYDTEAIVWNPGMAANPRLET